MKAGLFFLVLGYVLSQFYRSFLAVLTPVLGADLGATAADLSFASGLWFFVFAAMQIPVGWALDRFGPRRTAALLLALGLALLGGPQTGIVFAWPFFVYAVVFLAWQLQSNRLAWGMTLALQAMVNLPLVLFAH